MAENPMVSERDRPAPGFDIGAEQAARVRHAVAEIRRQCTDLAERGLALSADEAAEVRALVDGVSPVRAGGGSK